jgi:hypothetical protein
MNADHRRLKAHGAGRESIDKGDLLLSFGASASGPAIDAASAAIFVLVSETARPYFDGIGFPSGKSPLWTARTEALL